ncbi:MAG: HD domain-containing protein [Christensenellaceae bacterium]|jgi:5'-deoxynucleotidase YfbR-like HD superfamily hydrolase|nr:HD domain-containing protein [Christensenellaceae bacterium]
MLFTKKSILNESAKKMANHHLFVCGIKNVDRYGYSEKHRENNPSHFWLMNYMARKFIKEYNIKGLDLLKVLDLIDAHDFGEYGMASDFVSLDTMKSKCLAAYKDRLEREIIQEVAHYSGRGEFEDLWWEYHEQKTQEAKFVKALDKIEAIVHLLSRGFEKYNVEQQIEYIEIQTKKIEAFPQLLPVWNELKKRAKEQLTEIKNQIKFCDELPR